MSELLHVSSSPHVRSKVDTSSIMLTVIIALLPATLFGIYNFGPHALLLILVTIAACVATEAVYEKIVHKKLTVKDYSAVVTGLLLALNLPPKAPWWIAVIGGIFAILVVKQLFGGLGQNFMNPALAARCFLLISFTGRMTDFAVPDGAWGNIVDTVSGATPLAAMKSGETVDLLSLFIGNVQGTIGETSALAILIGAASDPRNHRFQDPGCLYPYIQRICSDLWGTWTGFLLSALPALRRRTDAGSMVYGDRLCYISYHKQGTDRIRYLLRDFHRSFPYLRRICRRRFLCDHLLQPAGSAY